MLRKGLLHGNGTLQRAGGRGEGDHEAVAHRLQLRAAVRLKRVAHDALLDAEQLPRLGVAKALCQCGRLLHIGEEDGPEGALVRRLGFLPLVPAFIQEPHHQFHVRGVTVCRASYVALESNEAGIRNEGGDIPSGPDGHVAVAAPVQDERRRFHLRQERRHINARVEFDASRCHLRRGGLTEEVRQPALGLGRPAGKDDVRNSSPRQAPVPADKLQQTLDRLRPEEVLSPRIWRPEHQPGDALWVLSRVGDGDRRAVY